MIIVYMMGVSICKALEWIQVHGKVLIRKDAEIDAMTPDPRK